MADDTQLDRAFDSILRRQESLLERPLRANFDQLSKDILLAWQQHGENGALAVVELNDLILEEILHDAYIRSIIAGSKFSSKQVKNTEEEEEQIREEVLLLLFLWVSSQAAQTSKEINRTTRKIFNGFVDDVELIASPDRTITDFSDSVTDRAEKVSDLMKTANNNRAKTIATTESQKAIQTSVQKSTEVMEIRQGVVMLKTWKTQGDSKVRDSHARVNGQQKRIGEMFLVGAGRGLHPQATTLPLAEKINCRCYLKLSKQMT